MDSYQFTNLIALLGVLSRAADIMSTKLVSPTLALEANPLMRRLGWAGAYPSILLGLVAYWHVELGVMVIVASLLVAGSNLFRGWYSRFVGEKEVERLMIHAARQGRLRTAIAFTCGGGLCITVAGALTMWLSGPAQWGYWAGSGVAVYGLAIAGHGSAAVVRWFRKAAKLQSDASEASP
ncbi:MAG TPA: hypothetical protein VJO33_10845 [Gemmatimonadaceae bacterium]|nr:hypothetical protein [Gemmatimonadaceae bacterium]